MKEMRLYDTMTRSVLPLEPMDGTTFRFYCCGPTVYGAAHIGNFRTFLMQDVFRRTLEASGMTVRHVRNITDVDDKTIRQSQAEGLSLSEFTKKWTEHFHADCEALHVLPPHVEPSAVGSIDVQIELIERLVKNGFAYVAEDGSVYFDVSEFPSYGRLSRLQEREITTGQAPLEGPVTDDEYDRDSAADFALWKAQRAEDGDNAWPSPWGRGRPGWHIECSAMSMQHLGESFDLHGGGIDLIFPHHENEIAQSEAATGKNFVTHWFHIAHLMIEGRKMSKSLGNLYTLNEVAERGFTPMELRYVLISGSYRQPLNFTWESMNAARQALRKLAKFRGKLAETAGEISSQNGGSDFDGAMDALRDDLNTPEALGRLFSAANELERRLNAGKLSSADAAAALAGLDDVLQCLGIELETTDAVVDEAPAELMALAEQRWEAKQSKDFATADRLRAEISQAGWTVKDSADGFSLVK